MKSRTLTFVMAAFAVAGLVACGGGEQAAPAPAPSADAGPAATGGSGKIAGTISYANGDPDSAIDMNADPVCAGLHPDAVHTESVVADGGGLANVFVYVKEGATGSHPAPAEAHVLDQQGCQYHPHVSGVQVGQKIEILNSDDTLHNVHALPEKNAEFNQGQPFKGMKIEKTFDKPEVMVRFKCDVHPWMSSYMGVVEHPYFAVSGADGSFSIEGLPAGDYVIEAWHETLGTQEQSVTVTDDAPAEVSFDFTPAA